VSTAIFAAPMGLNRVRKHLERPADNSLTVRELPVFRARPTVVPGPGHENRPSRRRAWKTSLGMAAAVLAVIVVASVESWKATPAASHAAVNQSAETLRSVTIAQPARTASAGVVLPATVRPWQTATLHARVSGYLTAWHKDLGESVKAGDVLAEIDTPELDQEVAQGEALVREATAAVAQARAERAEAEADLQVAEAQLDRIEADKALAKSQLLRREKLVASRAVSQEELETAQRQVEARTADVTAAQADIVRRRTNLETRTAIIEVREATAKSRLASVSRLKELQGFKRIVAPFDGVIIRRTAEVGMLVTAGQESLFVVEDMSRVRVQVNVPQTYAVQTSRGAAAMVSVPESTRAAVAGTVTRIGESMDAANRTMLVEIELENGSRRFQPGSYAQVALAASEGDATWTIPSNTLAMRVDGTHVAVVDDQNQVMMKLVVLGRNLGSRVEVIEGIHGNERLVVNPTDDLTNGMRVQVGKVGDENREVARK